MTLQKKDMGEMSVFKLIEHIVELTSDSSEFILKNGTEELSAELGERLGISQLQAVLLSAFVDQFDDNSITIRDIASHFGMRAICILSVLDDIEVLVQKGFLCKRKNRNGSIYCVDKKAMECMRENLPPKPRKIDNLSIEEFVETANDYLQLRSDEGLDDDELHHKIDELINRNQHLLAAQKMKGLGLDSSDLVLFLVTSMLYIYNRDEHVIRSDVAEYFKRPDLNAHLRELENGTHVLMKLHLVEHFCADGQVDSEAWRLSDYAKSEVYSELNLMHASQMPSNVTSHETIQEKKLYYNDDVTKQVEQLRTLLDAEKMERIMNRLADKGMRKGFTCLFYGAPGTGKTETAMQLARMSKRDVMLVNVPDIRSKWVGETEKNVKDLFDRYRKAAKNNTQAPILLFNEADALLNKRNEGTTDSVDKMENAMQNIILQEMENIEGIMIATTNLTGNLDNAFDRRFLYKIEFPQPTAKERQHIWKEMLPELTTEQAYTLASRFDFSGGQIENVVRKRLIADILNERDDIDMEAIIENCKTEKLNGRTSKRIGFSAA